MRAHLRSYYDPVSTPLSGGARDPRLCVPAQSERGGSVGTGARPTRPGLLCGTDRVISHGRGCDWWSLGCLLYELVVGHTPWMLDADLEPTFDVADAELSP